MPPGEFFFGHGIRFGEETICIDPVSLGGTLLSGLTPLAGGTSQKKKQ
jgi:hypothetical protein